MIPNLACFTSENLFKFLNSIYYILERCSLELSFRSNSSPSSPNDVKVFWLVSNDLNNVKIVEAIVVSLHINFCHHAVIINLIFEHFTEFFCWFIRVYRALISIFLYLLIFDFLDFILNIDIWVFVNVEKYFLFYFLSWVSFKRNINLYSIVFVAIILNPEYIVITTYLI